jgi:hypothetical protein
LFAAKVAVVLSCSLPGLDGLQCGNNLLSFFGRVMKPSAVPCRVGWSWDQFPLHLPLYHIPGNASFKANVGHGPKPKYSRNAHAYLQKKSVHNIINAWVEKKCKQRTKKV